MLDYLGQLALRVQQPELAVQPRPVSQFESPRHATLVAPEPPAPGETDEPESPFMPAETSAGKPAQQVDSRNHHESETVNFLSEARSPKESHKSYSGHSTAAPSIVTPAISTEATHQPWHEVVHPTLNRRSAAQSDRIARSSVEQAQPPVRIDRPEEQAGMALSNSSGRRVLSELVERVIRGERKQIWSPVRIDKLEEQTDMAAADPSGRREFAELKGPAVQGEREPIRPLVTIANPQERWASPLSPRALYHREKGVESEPGESEYSEAEPLFGRKTELMPKSEFDPMPGREIFEPFASPPAPQLAAERVADAPTIQVTIGRVEIRATVASAPTRKTPAQAPVMSLDEYLRQRNGGRG